MIFGLLVGFYVFAALLLVLLVMIQKSKGSTGLGSLGGHTQMIFGASGGQDIFQKITWTLGAFIMIGSLLLSLLNQRYAHSGRYLQTQHQTEQQA